MEQLIKDMIANKEISVISETEEAIYIYGDVKVMQELVDKYGYDIYLFKKGKNGYTLLNKTNGLLDAYKYSEILDSIDTEGCFYDVIKSKEEFDRDFEREIRYYSHNYNGRISFDDIVAFINNSSNIKKAIDDGKYVVIDNNFKYIIEFAKDEKTAFFYFNDFFYILGLKIPKNS